MVLHEASALRTALFGSFTAPGVEEAVADFQGCESHATGFGGSILLRKIHGSWAMEDYTPGLITAACETYHLKTGRDLLLCEGKDHHMAGASQWISLCDFSRDQTARCKTVFGVIDAQDVCGNYAVSGSIDKVELRDLNGDGMPDLTLWISVGQGVFAMARDSCNAHTSPLPVQKYKLDFLFQQGTDSFLPAPSSRPLAERLRGLFHDAQEKAVKAISPGSTP